MGHPLLLGITFGKNISHPFGHCKSHNNLEDDTIRGEKSEGMLLAASDAKGLSLVILDRTMVLGSAVS